MSLDNSKNPFAGQDAAGRKEVWDKLLAGVDHEAIRAQEQEYPPSEEALQRLRREGEDQITFNMRLMRFGFLNGWRGGTPAGAAALVEGKRLVDAFGVFMFGKRVELDFSQLPRDENGDIALD